MDRTVRAAADRAGQRMEAGHAADAHHLPQSSEQISRGDGLSQEYENHLGTSKGLDDDKERGTKCPFMSAEMNSRNASAV